VTLERLWAGWRSAYVTDVANVDVDGCVFCAILTSGLPDTETHIVWRGDQCVVILNAYPYTSGHLMVLPRRHVGELEDLDAAEHAELWRAATDAVRAIKRAYQPGGVNLGANLGLAAGAGVPGHAHVHVVPRWTGDTNFMTSIAETRVLPESLDASARRIRDGWPGSDQ
jgi:diadenosine tetraphosphate (Ap4A) HIT family hydrolase